jgi:hypothetical protein
VTLGLHPADGGTLPLVPEDESEPSLPSRVRLSLSDPERHEVELGMADILITALRRPEIVEG